MHRTVPEQALAGMLAGLLAALLPSVAAAQRSQEVRFETVDKVELKGTFYPSGGGNKSPCVLFLHKLGGFRTQDGWDDLAKVLQSRGFAVLSFDFRGHNDSTTVDPEVFWQSPNTRVFKMGKDSKDKISSADFVNPKKKNGFYVPVLVNDIEAAKNQLINQNNANNCNLSNLILVGADEGAALGSLWLWSQYQKPRWVPNVLFGGYQPDPLKKEGDDVAACVWLSMPSLLNQVPVARWLTSPGTPIAEKTPMAFFFGDKDTHSQKAATSLVSALKQGHRLPDTTKTHPIKGTKATGNELLKGSLPTNEEIATFLKAVMEKRGNIAWEKRAQVPLQPVQLSPYFNIQ